MARGGGARKVRPEGQPMRCVVQLLSTGGKSACARPRTESPRPYRDVVARDIPHPRREIKNAPATATTADPRDRDDR